MKNKTLVRISALVLALVLVVSGCAVVFGKDSSENTASASEAAATTETIADDTLLVTINGQEIYWKDISGYYDELVADYGSSYDLTNEMYNNLFKATALNEAMVMVELEQIAAERGIAVTDEDKAEAIANADADWDAAMESYISYSGLATSTDEEKAAALAEAEAYYAAYGYSKESVEQNYVDSLLYDKVYQELIKDAAVSDEEVQAYIDGLVADDQALYADDLEGYCTAVSNAELMAYYNYMMGGEYSLQYPYYKPAGFRAVKHILLSVDEELLTAYNDLVSKYDEQQSAAAAEEDTEAAAEETAEAEEVVTLEMINEAKAAILASRQDDIDAILTRYAAGEEFDALITEFDGDFDKAGGTGTFEMCAYSTGYVAGFVDAGMSIAAIGELSAPVVTSYGIHILQYVADVEGGSVITDEEKASIAATLLETAQSNAYTAALEAFEAKSEIVYTGVVPSIQSIYDQMDASAAE